MSKRFTLWRTALYVETYEVVADNEDEARLKIMNGQVDPLNTEFIEWAGDNFELEHVEELEPLYRMVKDYKCATS